MHGLWSWIRRWFRVKVGRHTSTSRDVGHGQRGGETPFIVRAIGAGADKVIVVSCGIGGDPVHQQMRKLRTKPPTKTNNPERVSHQSKQAATNWLTITQKYKKENRKLECPKKMAF